MNLSARYVCALMAVGAVLLPVNGANGWNIDECGFLKAGDDGQGGTCLLFESDSGPIYELNANNITYIPGNRALVQGNLTCQATCPGVSGCINGRIRPCYATSEQFTTTDDFRQGEFINLNADGAQLNVNTWNETITADPPVLPYLWVACSTRGTVVKIATADHYSPIHGRIVETGEILGEYHTAPEGCPRNPSRTSVDFDGNVWVANRSDISEDSVKRGHVVKIGSGLSFEWTNRNAVWQPDTSDGLGTILAWEADGDGCHESTADTAEDELVLIYHVIDPLPLTSRSFQTRTTAVDRENNVWVGGDHYTKQHDLLNGQTGAVLTSLGDQSCGGYGGIVDCNGVLWSARGSGTDTKLLRHNPSVPETRCIDMENSYDCYGLAVDTEQFIWATNNMTNRVTRIDPTDPDNEQLHGDNTYPVGQAHRGITVTPGDNEIWVASSVSHNLTRFWVDASAPENPTIELRGHISLQYDGHSALYPGSPPKKLLT